MQPSDQFTPEIPDVIGPFRILRLLGEGGMGVVYLGERMEQFSQQVAIKVLYPHLFPGNADTAIEREGQVLAALDHPGIVRMLDLGATGNGLRYIVMEYVDGLPIDVFCDQQRLPVRQRIATLLDAFDAVEYAHRHLVIHADLKPANILVGRDGKPRLLDFGVATVLSDSAHRAAERGEFTEMFASPEQRSGERLTVASDLYSLGLIAQFVVTGYSPGALKAASPARGLKQLNREVLAKIASDRGTTPAGLIAAVSGDVEAILGKSLQVDPTERFQSVQEMRDEFERYLLGYPIQIRPAGTITKTRKWVLRNKLAAAFALVFLLVLIFSVAGVVYQAGDAARKRQIAITRLHDLVRLTDVLAGELYSSVHGLQGADKAQDALLTSAHQTIDKLAANDGEDPELAIELAGEYEKLAKLELNREARTSEAVRQSINDLNKGIDILSRLRSRDPAAAKARQMLPEMVQLRDSALTLEGKR